ncbi:MAG TPA: hypothetical protein VLB44_17840 [Kofleriaceae bacterium]|nr:hypothetical protein [Kofleriaceae bacterium]
MRWLLFLLCGCNQVFGLTETAPSDAQFYDAPSRKPPRCPMFGESLTFSPTLHQLHYDCSQYNESTDVNLAVAMCRENDSIQPYSGPREGPFSPIPELPQRTIDFDVTAPQLDPEGDILMISTFDLTNTVGALRVYRRVADTWVRDADVPNAPPRASNISRGPDHRILGTNGTSDVVEISDASGSWQPIRTHTKAILGVPSVGAIWLSADALRIVFVANAFAIAEDRTIMYADRPTKNDLFGAARPIALPVVDDMFITENCGRVYFSGLRSIFYAESL